MTKIRLMVELEAIHDSETNMTNVFLTLPTEVLGTQTKQETAHLLAAGLGLLIKSCGDKDYLMMEEVIKHLNHEFASVNSFSNVNLGKGMFKDKEIEKKTNPYG